MGCDAPRRPFVVVGDRREKAALLTMNGRAGCRRSPCPAMPSDGATLLPCKEFVRGKVGDHRRDAGATALGARLIVPRPAGGLRQSITFLLIITVSAGFWLGTMAMIWPR